MAAGRGHRAFTGGWGVGGAIGAITALVVGVFIFVSGPPGSAASSPQSGSVSATEREPPLPPNADVSKSRRLDAVTCPVRGGCVAAGNYVDTSGRTGIWLASQSSGGWSASGLLVPGDEQVAPH